MLKKIYKIQTFIYLTVTICCVAIALGYSLGTVHAVSAEYTQSYKSNNEMTFGSLVSLVEGKDAEVEVATLKNVNNFAGVSVDSEGSTLAVNKNSDKIQIATSGKVIALVSDSNGSIKKGDLLSVSVVDGVASKASNSMVIIGSATADFDVNDSKNTKQDISLANGTNQQVTIGPLEVDLIKVQTGSDGEKGLMKLLENISGETVSTTKLVAIAVIILAVITSIVAMSYSAIKAMVTQASRNPLARPVMMKVLARIIVIIIATAVIGNVLIYVILKI